MYFTPKSRVMSNKVFYLKGVFTDRNTLFNLNRKFTTFCDIFRDFIGNTNW